MASLPSVYGYQVIEDKGTPQIRYFDEEMWDELRDETDYWKDSKELEVEEDVDPVLFRHLRELQLGPFKYVLLSMVIILLFFALLKIFTAELLLQPKKLDSSSSMSIDDVQDGQNHLRMNQVLTELLENGDYSGAIRIYYLLILQKLNEKGLIRWQRQKTNFNYLSEMRTHIHHPAFRLVTRIFEKVRYGHRPGLSQLDFEKMEPSFRDFLHELE